MVDRREQILAAARELAASGGLAAVSVRSVATRAGIGASTLRHYFPKQQELHDAVLGATFDANLRDLRIAETAVSAEDRLVECLWQFLPPRGADELSLAQWAAQVTAVLQPDASAEVVRVWVLLVARGRERVALWLEQLADEGIVERALIQRHVRLLLALIDGVGIGLMSPGEERLTHDEADGILRDAVRGVLARG